MDTLLLLVCRKLIQVFIKSICLNCFLFGVPTIVFAQKEWKERFFETTDYGKVKDRHDGVFKQYDYVWAQSNGLYVVKKKVFVKDSLPTLQSYVINEKGKIITKKVYTDISDFSDGMAEVTVGHENFCRSCFDSNRYNYVSLGNAAAGFINTAGEEVIPPRYNYVEGGFRYGLCVVGDYMGFRIIDKEGKTKFDKTFTYGERFHNGIAFVKNKEENYIDTTGKYLIPNKYLYIERFSYEFRGRIRAFQMPNEKFGFWTSENLALLEAQFDAFNYDLWKLRVWVKKGGKIGFLDYYTGETIVPLEYDDFEKGKNPKYILLQKGKMWYRVNFEGKADELIEAEEIKAVNAKYFKAKLSNSKWVLIDSLGKEVNERKFSKISGSLNNGYLLVSVEKKVGYLDSNGTEIIPAIYDKIGKFKDGKVFAEKGIKLYEIDTHGIILKEEYTMSFVKKMLFCILLFFILIIAFWVYREAKIRTLT